MKNRILASLLAIIVSIGLGACIKEDIVQKDASVNEKKYETKDNIKTKGIVEEELKEILSQSLQKYFDIDINKENMSYYIKNELDKKDKITEDFDDLEELYIEARPKDVGSISKIEMKYNSVNKYVEYMSVDFKVEDSSDKINEEEAKLIAEKFLRDKGLINREIDLRFNETEESKGYIKVEFNYIEKNKDEEVKVSIDKRNKKVNMFDMD